MAEIKCPKCGTVISLEQSDLDSVVRQVRDEEFARDLAERVKLVEAEKEREIELAETKASAALREREHEKDAEIEKLRMQLESQRSAFETERELAVAQAVASVEKERDALKASVEAKAAESLRSEAAFKEQMEEQAKSKDQVIAFQQEEIERLKDFKARLTTKMIGEELEVHCANEFNAIRATAFPNATFERDTESVGGTKGDFIYRELADDGTEIISIMFEMKNEEEGSHRRTRNEDHFAKLDKDRTNKQCEYAVLVSMLEPESDLYNNGIVDVSWQFPKMYVVRPQFFIPIISLLRNAAMSSLEYKRELALVRQQDLDVTTFERDLDTFKQGFFKNFEDASKRYDDAIEGINKTIALLEKIKDNLTKSEKHLTAANNKLEGLTVKKLTRKNPTMKAKFEALEQDEEE
ncbi:MAG: DUF2130 domain-containing protein [Eggerthellaceae bacterium]|nr:DUF2130 domain-containing protein [Eggerthellaceae bacterium]